MRQERLSVSKRSFVFACVLALFALAATPVARGQVATTDIKVDQVGYLPAAQKIAFIATSGETAQSFSVKRSSDNKVAFEGKLGARAHDSNTGDDVQAADFSILREPGRYYIEVPGIGRSWNFSIEANVYARAYKLVMLGFYGQRCGREVDLGSEFPGYKHAACHVKGEFHSTSGKSGDRDNLGGWHDAGDYGRYVVNSGISTGSLLWAWELYASNLKNIKLKIPESGNGTPDILNEARWNLEWMLEMQDDDGGVWHKQTSPHFAGFVLPEDDTLVSEVIGTGTSPYKSTCATADLAAVAAIAARLYKPFDEKFAAKNLQAARQAWLWTEKNPNVTFKNPPGISTGEYGDNDCTDERVWAAAELWRTTGNADYNDFFLKNYAEFQPKLDAPPAEGWREVAPMGLWTYALAKRQGSDASAVAAIRTNSVELARRIAQRTAADPYHVSLVAKDYVWGSNGVAASYGLQLLVANAFSPDPALLNAATDDLHYLLGRNTFSLSWVTQLGEHPYRYPHHRPSGADENKEPWPGLLSGGPNAGRQDAVLAKLAKGLPPAKVYADDQGSYASNEIAINWQAAVVFLLAGTLQ
ncbi:MAG TPA: glycoside hydrolase family 9 protein [Terriglobales bacterium]|nr:glycoside hydrolase family 9 protein [Terriglobales bacterium]